MARGRPLPVASRIRLRARLWTVLFAAALALTGLAGSAPPATAAGTVRLYAAASTLGALNAAAKAYLAETGVRIVPVYASSGTLARQIAAGAPADLFLSANRRWMDWAVANGAARPHERRVLLTNGLVVALPAARGHKVALKKGMDLRAALGGLPIATANPAHAPLGVYARAALKSLGLWKQVGPGLLRLSDAARARILVERGEAAGILYASDAYRNPKLFVAARFAANTHPPITYEIALTAAGAKSADARRLFAWLGGDEARAIFESFGFGRGAGPWTPLP